MNEGKQLYNFVKKYNTHILSAYVEHAHDSCTFRQNSMGYENTNIDRSKINLVMRSQKKNYAMVESSQYSILIDDYVKA